MSPVRPFRDTMAIDEARELMFAAARPIDRIEQVPIAAAHGRVLAEAVTSRFDVPPFDRAAMDGYAVIAADTAGASRAAPRTLRCVGSVFTGQVLSTKVDHGGCIEIATGAPLPPGADAVVMAEDTERIAEDAVRVLAAAQPRQHVGRRGGDIAADQRILDAGVLLTPSRVGALAAAGLSHVPVYARPRVAIISTGNEIVEPGRDLQPGQIYDINRFTLAAVVEEHGGAAVPYPSVADALEDLTAALSATSNDDIVVLSGGSSVGERDLVRDVLANLGEVIFHGIAVKPGKPTALARVGRRLVLGMPGNPTSCLSNAYILLVPMLRRIARLPAHRPTIVHAPLARRVVSPPGRHQFYTVRLEDGAAVPAFKGSGEITSLSRADGYFEIPADVESVEAGELVDVTLF